MPRLAQCSAAALLLTVAWFVVSMLFARADEKVKRSRVDPAAWGSDHVGKPIPDYLTGDECLFCHRKIGPAWRANHHQLTVRPSTPDEPAIAGLRARANGKEFADDTRFLLGSKRTVRFLKRSKQYGKLDMLTAAFEPNGGELNNAAALKWDSRTFADRCAGCHTTAVHSRTRAFSSVSLDCFTCHGNVELAHTKDISRVLLSSKNAASRQVVSICGQCHLRGGKSKSSGLPYPNTFVAGDNLFRDFVVDLSDEAIKTSVAIDQHIYLNARDVAVYEQTKTTCLTCHSVHGQNTEMHQQLDDSAICASCHIPGTDNTRLIDAVGPANRRRAHSRVCDY
jgi:hypothetical protein